MDSFSANVISNVRAELKRINAFPAIILGGCTSKAQPLDVVINKPYKDKIRKLWTLFMQDRQTQAKDSLSLVGAISSGCKWVDGGCPKCTAADCLHQRVV